MPSETSSRSSASWYVLRAYKAEKRAEEVLKSAETEFFIAKRWAVRTYHGRKGRYLVPAIPSLVFVKSTPDGVKALKAANTFLQYVMDMSQPKGEPLIVPTSQMENFIRISSRVVDTDKVTYLTLDEADLPKGTMVRIHGGVFDGAEGRFVRVKGRRDRRLVVELPGLGTAVAAEVHPDLVEPLDKN